MKPPMDIRHIKNNSRTVQLIIALLCVSMITMMLRVDKVAAHGTVINTTIDEIVVSINAMFDTGDPMDNAQLTVYAPSNPETALISAVATEDGNFTFDVDPADVGEWAIRIRHSGHGAWVYVDVAENGAISLREQNQRPRWQTWGLATLVIAGLGGVALWAMRGTNESTS